MEIHVSAFFYGSLLTESTEVNWACTPIKLSEKFVEYIMQIIK